MGMHLHDVFQTATPRDLTYFVALRNIERREEERANKRAKIKRNGARG